MQENQAGSAREPVDVIVVGAGMAGLAAAGELARAGLTVMVLEKSRGLGGRMATRRFAGAVCDHGAQFFTVRTPPFESIVTAARDAGKVRPWCEGFFKAGSLDRAPENAGDGHARWCGSQGMTDLPKFLAGTFPAERCAIRLGTKLASLGIDGGNVRACLDDGSMLSARAGVLTAPVPQTLDLLAAGGLLVTAEGRYAAAPAGALDPDAILALAEVGYDPCFALMLVLKRPSLVPAPGGIQFASGPLAWLGDNFQKGISSLPALTVHASGAFSREHFDTPPEEVSRLMLEACGRGSTWATGPELSWNSRFTAGNLPRRPAFSPSRWWRSARSLHWCVAAMPLPARGWRGQRSVAWLPEAGWPVCWPGEPAEFPARFPACVKGPPPSKMAAWNLCPAKRWDREPQTFSGGSASRTLWSRDPCPPPLPCCRKSKSFSPRRH